MSSHRAAMALYAVAAVEIAAAGAAWLAGGMSMTQAVNSFVITHGALGLTLPICGGLLAWHRPANPTGWLFLAAGVGHAAAAAAPPMVVLGRVCQLNGVTGSWVSSGRR